MLSEMIALMLATRGELLTKDEMTDSLKTDQVLNEAAAFEYNNPDKYNEDEHPELKQSHARVLTLTFCWTNHLAIVTDHNEINHLQLWDSS